LTWPSEEFDLCGREEGAIKFGILLWLAFMFLLAGDSTAIDSSPTSFFAIDFVKSRQNLSTSDKGMDFSFPNKY
jgi:hypothetical protein